MPAIRSSAELRNSYGEIASLCHQSGEPVFITRNGKGDLAVMSMEAYDQLIRRMELYRELGKGIADAESGRTKPLDEAMKEIRERLKNAVHD